MTSGRPPRPEETPDVSQLAAGRELDALVAERVMGFWFDEGQWWCRHRDGGARAYATAYLNIWGPSYAYDGLPKFSTDIAAAWEVVGKLAGRDTKRVLHLSYDESGCWARFNDTRQHEGLADTASLAICRAALLAVGAPQTTQGEKT